MKKTDDSLRIKRGMALAFFVYLLQFPVLLGGIQGWFPVHPILIFPPLVGLINAKLEKRGPAGLGLTLPYPGRSLLLAFILAVVFSLSIMHVFSIDGIAFSFPELGVSTFFELLTTFSVAIFILAMWEEFVSRGFIQTRLQEAWGLFGVMLSALMFATLHLPSAILEFEYEPSMVLLNVLQMFVPGLMLSVIYWKTRSTLTTIAVHGFRNFVFSVAYAYSGLDAGGVHLVRPGVQILWRLFEILLAWVLLHVLFRAEYAS